MHRLTPMSILPNHDIQDVNLMDKCVPEALRSEPSTKAEFRYRPRYHFTPRQNWMNDPNGLVYFAGEYHLFFQYNPCGDQWGHMSWGHAVSRNLLNWEELPVAIPETDQEMIFSGCVVVDWQNVSGLARGDEPPFLAFYTGFDVKTDVQRQCLAYSHDRGRTFIIYDGNPLIDLEMAHFRDPKVFFHEESAAWVMAVSLPREHKVAFYRSNNLLEWDRAGSFGPAGATSGQWECPDLIQVPLGSDSTRTRWVLKVDVDAGFIGGGSGAQYFVGDFDGSSFTIDPSVSSAHGEPVDLGPDFYAAVTWSDLPREQPGPLWVGWMSNHQTGRSYPTSPWRGAQSLPRSLYLFEEQGRLKLGQRPLASAADLFGASDGQDFSQKIGTIRGRSFHARLYLNSGSSDRQRIELVSRERCLLFLAYDPVRGLVFRRAPQPEDSKQSFMFETSTPYPAGEQISVDVFFDGCLADIFVDGGRRVFSCCVFPEEPESVSVQLTSGPG